MSEDEKKLLADVMSAIDGISVHLLNINTFADFKANYTARRAIER